MDNDQHASKGVGSGQDKALLAMVVGIRHGTGQLVVENLNRVGEIDAVLTPVFLVTKLRLVTPSPKLCFSTPPDTAPSPRGQRYPLESILSGLLGMQPQAERMDHAENLAELRIASRPALRRTPSRACRTKAVDAVRHEPHRSRQMRFAALTTSYAPWLSP